MARKCGACQGSGTMPEHLEPYGYRRTAGMGMVVCKTCGGTGKARGGDDTPSNLGKAHPVVWFFGLVGALFAGVLKPLGNADWFVNAVLGFVVVGMAAGYLKGRTYGRIILAILGLGILALFALTIYMAETGRMG